VVALDPGARPGAVVGATARVAGAPQDAVAANNQAAVSRPVAAPGPAVGLPRTGAAGPAGSPRAAVAGVLTALLGAAGLGLLARRRGRPTT
jgi:hypothetical protein